MQQLVEGTDYVQHGQITEFLAASRCAACHQHDRKCLIQPGDERCLLCTDADRVCLFTRTISARAPKSFFNRNQLLGKDIREDSNMFVWDQPIYKENAAEDRLLLNTSSQVISRSNATPGSGVLPKLKVVDADLSSLVCEVCGKVFHGKAHYLKSNLRRHMRDQHEAPKAVDAKRAASSTDCASLPESPTAGKILSHRPLALQSRGKQDDESATEYLSTTKRRRMDWAARDRYSAPINQINHTQYYNNELGPPAHMDWSIHSLSRQHPKQSFEENDIAHRLATKYGLRWRNRSARAKGLVSVPTQTASTRWHELMKIIMNRIAPNKYPTGSTDSLETARFIAQVKKSVRDKDHSDGAGHVAVPSPDRPFICTLGCPRNFKTKHDWIRHEELIFPQHVWRCDHSDCRMKPLSQQKAFLRKDKFKDHRIRHGLNLMPSGFDDDLPILIDWGCEWSCPVCLVTSASWKARVDHISQHFQEHVRMPNKDEPGTNRSRTQSLSLIGKPPSADHDNNDGFSNYFLDNELDEAEAAFYNAINDVRKQKRLFPSSRTVHSSPINNSIHAP
ncbi:hypothetical protein MMC17_006557 [Xylographa soralifera]|nr:hypothetical protein [Xylographa soralifera]